MSDSKVPARFIEPMLLLRTTRVPEGAHWLYEAKFDGYRAIGINAGGKVHLRSRNDKISAPDILQFALLFQHGRMTL